MSEHRDGCSSRERRRRASPKPQPSPAACALPASFATAAARQNIDRRICRQRRNGEAEHATKLVITHIASLLCRSSSLRTSPNRTEGAGSIDPIKLSAGSQNEPGDRLLYDVGRGQPCIQTRRWGLDVRVGPELRCVLLISYDVFCRP